MWTRSRCSRPFDRRDRRKHPCDRATSPMRERSVVFPVPRAPTNIVERFGLPGPSPNALAISRSNRSRPAKNGGTIPNVGVNGLRLSSASSPSATLPLPCSIFLQFSTSFADFDFARNSHPESPNIKIIPLRYEIPRPPIRTARSGQEARLPAGKAVRRQRRFRWRSQGR